MTNEIKEENNNKESKKKEIVICPVCHKSNPENRGPGRSDNADLANAKNGIDICYQCGGIARIHIDNAGFKKKKEQLLESRWEIYSPPVLNGYPDLPALFQLQTLEKFIQTVTDFYKTYGIKNVKCFARDIAKGILQPEVNRLKKEIRNNIRSLNKESKEVDTSPETIISNNAQILALKGKINEANLAFLRAIKQYPKSSVIAFRFAMFQLVYLRKTYGYLFPLFEKATKIEPEKARTSYFRELAICRIVLEEYAKALEAAKGIMICPDSDILPKEMDRLIETIESRTPCNYCCGGGPCDIGSGRFRDFDSDLACGIDICPGCGGLGIIPKIKLAKLKRRTQKISELRNAYCPIDEITAFPIPETVLIPIVRQLETEVKNLFRDYGEKTDASFAAAIAQNKVLQKRIGWHKRAKKEKIARLNFVIEELKKIENQHSETDDRITNYAIQKAAWEGKGKEEIKRRFDEAMKEFPNSSRIPASYAEYLALFCRDFDSAIPLLERAIKLEMDFDKLSELLYRKAQCLSQIRGKELETYKTAKKALQIPGIDPETKKQIERFAERELKSMKKGKEKELLEAGVLAKECKSEISEIAEIKKTRKLKPSEQKTLERYEEEIEKIEKIIKNAEADENLRPLLEYI